MRLIIILMTIGILHVSAAGYGQRITLSEKQATLENIINKIRTQSGYDFLGDTKLIRTAKPISIHVKDATIEDVLDICFVGQRISYSIDNKIVVLKEKELGFLENIIARAGEGRYQSIDVKGRVVDENGDPLVGASISVKNGKGTTTDKNGEFYLADVDEKASLVITYVGFVTKEISAKIDLGNLKLELADSKLSEVQVIGYGEVSRKYNTSNIGTIKGIDIEKQPVSNPLLALQGRTPGLFIQQTSGVTAGSVNVTVQGLNSISNGNAPFYVVDGVPYAPTFTDFSLNSGALPGTSSAFSFVNPSDIESISVLKDADATAIYGSRAANGAILITTKKGKAGKTKIDVNLQNGWGKVTRKLDVLNTQQYLEIRKEAYTNAKQAIPNSSTVPSSSNYDLTIWDQNKYTDWQKVLIGGTAGYTDLSATISGGSANTQFLGGYKYHRETTVYPGDLSDTKGDVHFNVNHSSTDGRFKYNLSASYLQDVNRLNNTDLTSNAIIMTPNAPDLYNPDGSLNFQFLPNSNISTFDNPLIQIKQQYKGNINNLIASNTISYEILQGLAIKASMGYNKLQGDETNLKPLDATYPSSLNRTREAHYLKKSIASWIIEPQITYSKSTKIGNLDFLLGSTFQQSSTDLLQQSGSGYATDTQLDNILAATNTTFDNVLKTLYKYSAVFGRVNYRLQDKYILNLTARRDGSSRFGANNKFNSFYAVGGAWLFGDEAIIKDRLPWLSFGKLRANYGTTGNDQITDYRYISYLSNLNPEIPYQESSSLYPTNIANPGIQWEETRKLNLGMDLGLLKNKVLINASYFRNRSSNQLTNYELPSMTGFTAIDRNLNALVQNTGFELMLDVEAIKAKQLSWHSSVNFTIPRNKLISYPGLLPTASQVIGQPTNVVRAYQYEGVNPTTGLYQFKNAKGELVQSVSFTSDRFALININPKFYGGFANTLSYKGFELDFLFQFVKQIGRNYHFGNAPGVYSSTGSNQPTNILERWQQPGNDSDIQVISLASTVSTPRRNASSSSRAYSDASYIRLKNASLSYSLPSTLLNNLRISNARVYVLGQNLLTITNYEGLDPETQSTSWLPPLRMITLGLQITF